ncbi:hypothetical protein MKX01_033695 [Papaver californicum]|nr:hypothetical protein MKX01_033695 [Papaver californicum]
MLEMRKMGKLACSRSKPHFFRPIHSDSSSEHQLAIPIAFQREYLVDIEDSEGGVATLKSPLKSWKIKLNHEFKFTYGWEDFYKAHELSTGNFLVFEYEGRDLIFQVWVFDLSLCEVEYSTQSLMSEGEGENEMHFGQIGAEGMYRAEGKGRGKRKRKGKGLGKKEQAFSNDSEVEEDSEESHDNDDATSISKYRHFITTLKSYNIGRSFLAIPTKFSKTYITDDVGDVVLMDEEGKEWPVKLTRRKDSYGVNFGYGWYDFQLKKGLKEGDICLFEQENEDAMEFTVSIIRK